MVLDSRARCQADVGGCTAADKNICCKPRRQCLNFIKDVPTGCGEGKLPNPYEYAFCRTVPCKPEDAEICCLEVQRRNDRVPMDGAPEFTGIFFKNLYERVDQARSKPSRPMPTDTTFDKTNPAITFSEGSLAWFDIGERIDQNSKDNSVYAPLVDFPSHWGNLGWSNGFEGKAWMKIRKGGEEKYKHAFIDPQTNEMGSWKDLYAQERRVKHPDTDLS